jgi:hypothetical protein
MKKILLLGLTLFSITTLIHAQTAAKPKALKKVLELKMPKTADDDMPGTRGASVAWHPLQKKYYAVFAGNKGYPLAVFNATGKRLSGDDVTAMVDTRGLWYNPVTKLVAGNGYDEAGWFTYTLSTAGIPTEFESVYEGQYQPDAQSVGAYNPVSKKVMFLKGGQVFFYNSDAEAVDSIAIHWSRTKSDGPADDEDPSASPEDYNYTTMIYTGIKGQEIGFLNITNLEIELYDIKNGYMTSRLALPENAQTEASFNFAYANGIYWLFNIELRKWIGYK